MLSASRSHRCILFAAICGVSLGAASARPLSDHNVVYTTPSPEVWEAMPVGGGDLSAMVRWDGSLRLHLSKSDAWGFQAPPSAPAGSRFFNNVSPGHVRVSFGPGAAQAAVRRFRQILDVEHGRVSVEIGSARIDVWGHPTRRVLVVEFSDPAAELGTPEVDLIEWRPTMKVIRGRNLILASEVHEREARPHLANTGMQEYFPPGSDPLHGRGLAVAVATRSNRIFIAAATTTSGDPLAAAQKELESAASQPGDALRTTHAEWWRDYWGKSFIRLKSSDAHAERLVNAYYVHLYTLGCVNRGAVPAKWDGGPGLLDGDRRNWGLAEWVQEIRFTYWPLYAANQIQQAQGLFRHYSAMLPYLERQTRNLWGLPGIFIPETVSPWGHAEDWVLKLDGCMTTHPHYERRDPARIPYGRFEAYNPYIGFLFTSGLEICHHYLTYYRYTGDERFLRDEAYPVLKGVSEFTVSLMRKESDGRFHLDPANALETWWMVRDPADTLAGIRAIFPEFVRLSRKYGRDPELRRRCAEILAALPEPAPAPWPAHASSKQLKPRNRENPALYRVAPFGLSGIGSADYDAARLTFENRLAPLEHGWSLDALWAARLGLATEAPRLLAEHARRYQRFRYGGWTSNDSQVFPGRLSVTPFLDAGGCSAVALQETLLQSHGGVIRILPAASPDWSGAFRLRAEGGFLVSVEFEAGSARTLEIQSLLGNHCAVENPWPNQMCVIRRAGRIIQRARGRTLHFRTSRDAVYALAQSQ
jgi:hypothetical protein